MQTELTVTLLLILQVAAQEFKMIYSPNKTLYGNFKMHEVCKSSTAVRLGIDNTPSDEVLERAEQTCIHILQPVRDEFGSLTANSWFRCEELERAITRNSFVKWCQQPEKYNHEGFDPLTDYQEAWELYFSRKSHPMGEAVDFEKAGVDNRAMFNWCKANLPAFDQLIAEFMKADDSSAGWIHGSFSANNNRQQIIEIK